VIHSIFRHFGRERIAVVLALFALYVRGLLCVGIGPARLFCSLNSRGGIVGERISGQVICVAVQRLLSRFPRAAIYLGERLRPFSKEMV
jgi:hypothetical protein